MTRSDNLALAIACVRARLGRLVRDDLDDAERIVLGQQIERDLALVLEIAQPMPARLEVRS